MKNMMAALFALFISACSYKMTVTANYNSSGVPVFSITAPRVLTLRPSPSIREVLVFEVIAGQIKKDNPLWRISSSSKYLSEITYGVVPRGFEQKIPPATLEVGKSYEVLVMGSGGVGGIGFTLEPKNSFEIYPVPISS
ncbi:MAG: hypothetical protein Q7U28_00005 [Aquabacterium sp.]|nr:hypothetical protein [Aquabacterium sp.]